MSLIIHIFLCTIFVNDYGWGLQGIGFAYFLTNVVLFFMLILYTRYIDELRDYSLLPDSDSFRGWGNLLAISIPCIILAIGFSWTLDLLIIFGGLIGSAELAAAGQLTAIIYFMKHFAIGIFETMVGLIGNLIGENQPKYAWKAYNTIFEVCCIAFIIEGMVVCFMRSPISSAITVNLQVQSVVYEAFGVVALFITLTSITTVQWSIMHAAKLQYVRMVMYIGAFYLIGVPVGALLALKGNYGIQGVLSGYIFAELIIFVVQVLITARIDLEEVVKESEERLQVEKATISKGPDGEITKKHYMEDDKEKLLSAEGHGYDMFKDMHGSTRSE